MGLFVGSRVVGCTVGLIDGASDGMELGSFVGRLVGLVVGLSVDGRGEGRGVGSGVGCGVGCFVGFFVGEIVGDGVIITGIFVGGAVTTGAGGCCTGAGEGLSVVDCCMVKLVSLDGSWSIKVGRSEGVDDGGSDNAAIGISCAPTNPIIKLLLPFSPPPPPPPPNMRTIIYSNKQRCTKNCFSFWQQHASRLRLIRGLLFVVVVAELLLEDSFAVLLMELLLLL